MSEAFDPNAAARPDAGIYGLPHTPDEAAVVVVPVPFAATTSYRRGAHKGPRAIFEASRQVDLFDLRVGRPYAHGIAMLPEPAEVLGWNGEASALADGIIEVAGVIDGRDDLARDLARVNELSDKVNAHVRDVVGRWLDGGKRVALVGGDHAVPFGAIEAHAARAPGFGVLHLDAHADLRPAYEGFVWSHASIMANVLDRLPGVAKIVQVGVRDFSEEEHARITTSGGRVVTFFDADLADAAFRGESWNAVCERIVRELPERVYLSFDIDGLDPTLCPNTGTPVPGGLSFHQIDALMGAVVRAGKTIIGLDLVEVAPATTPSGTGTSARDCSTKWSVGCCAHSTCRCLSPIANVLCARWGRVDTDRRP